MSLQTKGVNSSQSGWANSGRAGTFTETLAFWRPIVTADAEGQPVKDYQFLGEEWGDVIPVSGAERMKHGREEMATSYYRIKVRYNSTVKVTDKIRWNGLEIDIVQLMGSGRRGRDYLDIIGEILESKSAESNGAT